MKTKEAFLALLADVETNPVVELAHLCWAEYTYDRTLGRAAVLSACPLTQAAFKDGLPQARLLGDRFDTTSSVVVEYLQREFPLRAGDLALVYNSWDGGTSMPEIIDRLKERWQE